MTAADQLHRDQPRVKIVILMTFGRPGFLRRAMESGVSAFISEIAAKLYLSEGTVRNYLSACIQKTGARNRTEALHIAEERGWL